MGVELNMVSNEVLLERLDSFCERLDDLKSNMKNGFEGVHNRQDILNGKVADHSNRIQKIENEKETEEKFKDHSTNKIIITCTVIGTIVTVLAYLAGKGGI